MCTRKRCVALTLSPRIMNTGYQLHIKGVSDAHCRVCSQQAGTRQTAGAAVFETAGAAVFETAPAAAEVPTRTDVHYELACPICQRTPLHVVKHIDGNLSLQLSCKRCARAFDATVDYVDLTIASGIEKSSYEERWWLGTETFRRPLVSQIYERGWRQGFSWAGFPGVEQEFQLAMHYLVPQQGKMLVDMSCGSGLFTRRFALSGKFEKVVAADFSECMLTQTKELIAQDSSIDSASVLLVRADVARLPFQTGSLGAIHAGAALHCWPNPSAALAEISRVLERGGLFVGSTFLDGTAPLGQLFGNDQLFAPLRRFDPTQAAVSRQFRWWSESEVRDLFASVGLINFQRHRFNRFILWSVQKPDVNP